MSTSDILTFHLQSHDFDEIAASLSGWDQIYRQISAGKFHGELEYVHINGMEIFQLHWEQVIHYKGLTPPGTIGFGLPLNIVGESRYLQQAVSNEELLIQRCGREGNLIGGRNFKIHVITLNEQRFFKIADTITGMDSRQLLRNVSKLRLKPDMAQRLRRQFQSLLRQSNNCAANLNSQPPVLAQGAEHLLELIIDIIISGNPNPPKLRLMRQRQLVKKTEEYFWSQPAIAPRVVDLCAMIGTSERSLRDAFKECTGQSVSAYIKTLRLNQARAMLKSSSPENTLVQDVAFQWGFSHMGQFAADYKRLFGESPSDTLCKGAPFHQQ